MHLARQGQHFASRRAAQVDQHQGLAVVDADMLLAVAFHAGLVDQPAGRQFGLAGFRRRIERHVGPLGLQPLGQRAVDDRILEEAARIAQLGRVGELRAADRADRGGATLRNIRDAIIAIRQAKLPDTAVLGNAGSFFKNPSVELSVAERLQAEWPEMPLYPSQEAGKAKLAAGWLIDRAGMKGYREGSVGVHERQALVLVNHGGATGSEVIALARKVQAAVRDKFGVEIDTEVNIL